MQLAHHPALGATLLLLLTYQRADAKTSRPVYDPALQGRDDCQAGGRRDDGRDVRHRPAARPRAESRRLFHQARARRRATTAPSSIASSASASSRAAIRCRRIRRRRKQYGTGGLGVLKAEISGEKHTRGAVSAVLQPGKPDSGGAQFFVCVTDQPALDGNYTIFGRVVRGARRRAEDLGSAGRRTRRAGRAGRDSHASPFATRRRRSRSRSRPRSPAELARASRDARDHRGFDHRRVLPGQGARSTVRNFLRLASPRRLRRHVVSPRRERVRRSRPAR